MSKVNFNRLNWKLFISYIIILAIGTIVLNITARLTIPSTFNRHMSGMEMNSGSMMDSSMMMNDSDLFINFEKAFNEALSFAGIISFTAALLVSIYVASRFTQPIQKMMVSSQRIADGDYKERVQVLNPNKQDEFDQLAVSFNQMAASLENTEKMRQQLIGDVAHELRTPLTTIKGSMEGLIDGVIPESPETYQQLFLEADRMQNLVNDLQELSREESGTYPLDIQKISVEKIISSIYIRLEQQYKEKDVKITFEIESNIPDVMVDENRIGQVLINLVGNALQYTNSGGLVTIKAFQEEKEIIIAIKDSGIGIPKEHQKNIFQRFYRVDKSRSRSHGGSGIGLTISKHIVEAHNGHIWVESEGNNLGTTFLFSIPL